MRLIFNIYEMMANTPESLLEIESLPVDEEQTTYPRPCVVNAACLILRLTRGEEVSFDQAFKEITDDLDPEGFASTTLGAYWLFKRGLSVVSVESEEDYSPLEEVIGEYDDLVNSSNEALLEWTITPFEISDPKLIADRFRKMYQRERLALQDMYSSRIDIRLVDKVDAEAVSGLVRSGHIVLVEMGMLVNGVDDIHAYVIFDEEVHDGIQKFRGSILPYVYSDIQRIAGSNFSDRHPITELWGFKV